MVEISQNINYSEFDVIKFVQHILNEVENIRGVGSISPNDGLKSSTLSSFNESRLNAFFRLVGLPSFVTIKNTQEIKSDSQETGRIFSPGFQIGRNSGKEIENSERFGEMNLKSILAGREAKLLSLDNSRGSAKMNKYMTTAFYYPLQIAPNVPSDVDNLIERNVDAEFRRPIYKKLFPLVTSYKRIMPIKNEIARPFATEDQRKVDNSTILVRPFIETVARIRFVSAENASKEAQVSKEENKLSSLQSILSEEQYEKIENDFKAIKAAGMLERFILNKMVASIEQLARKWNSVMKERDRLLSENALIEVKLKTSSSRKNILGKAIQPSSNVELKNQHAKMKRIEDIKAIIASEEAFLMLLPSVDDIDTSKPTEAQTQNAISGSLLNEFNKLIYADIDHWKKELNKEVSQSKAQMQRAEKIRIELEMMTGEFSGISILDVIAVICSLFLISKSDLLALFDSQAIENMKNESESESLKSVVEDLEQSKPSLETAISNLESNVSNIFTMFSTISFRLEYNKKNVGKKTSRNRKDRKKKAEVQTISDVAEKTSDSVGEE